MIDLKMGSDIGQTTSEKEKISLRRVTGYFILAGWSRLGAAN
jgi:hypothetical protein